MDMKQLMTYVTLSQTLNYQKAAILLQYSPSTLFKHIQLLEQELGVPLFCKSGRRLQLTPEGENFRKHAKSILENYEDAMQSVAVGDEDKRVITIGGCELNTANSLLKLLTRFSQQHPSTRISMMTSPNADVPSLVQGGMIDLGFFYCVENKHYQGLQTVSLYQEPVYIIASRNHPLAARKQLTYDDIKGMDFVYPHDTCCFIVELMERLRKRNVQLGKVSYLGGMHLVVEHAHNENALSLIPKCALTRFKDVYGMVRLDMQEEPIWAWETIIYKDWESITPAAKALVNQSVRYAQNMASLDPAQALHGEEGSEPGTEYHKRQLC